MVYIFHVSLGENKTNNNNQPNNPEEAEKKALEQKFYITYPKLLWPKWYLSGTNSTLML